MPNKRIFVQCSTPVNRDAIKRASVDGVEHIIIGSYTLPDDIVMNGGLYPSQEVAASFKSLDRTLAPVEHPHDSQGNFISANDPIAINNFYAGAFNENVRRENGRVKIDKVINVQEALKTDRGKRLLDRINEIEQNDDPRPIHTSVGVFLEVEELDEIKTNAAGQEYTWIARNMVFDHDAILLDSVGAAQPDQGVGMAINRDGKKIKTQQYVFNTVKAAKRLPLADSDYTWDKGEADKRVRAHIGAEDAPNATYGRYHLWFNADDADQFGAYKLPFVDIIDGRPHAVPAALRNAAARLTQTQGPSASEKDDIRGIIDTYLERIRTNQELVTIPGQNIDDLSHDQLRDKIHEALNTPPLRADWVMEIYDNRVIYALEEMFFEVPYTIGNNTVTITGIPLPVERKISYVPKTNSKRKDAMRESLIKVLTDAGITVNADISDDDLLTKYNEHVNKQPTVNNQPADNNQGGDITEVITNALKPVMEKVEGLETKLNAQSDKELSDLAELVGNSDKYPGLDVAGAKALPVETLKAMAANCQPAYGVPLSVVNGGTEPAKFEMPE